MSVCYVYVIIQENAFEEMCFAYFSHTLLATELMPPPSPLVLLTEQNTALSLVYALLVCDMR